LGFEQTGSNSAASSDSGVGLSQLKQMYLSSLQAELGIAPPPAIGSGSGSTSSNSGSVSRSVRIPPMSLPSTNVCSVDSSPSSSSSSSSLKPLSRPQADEGEIRTLSGLLWVDGRGAMHMPSWMQPEDVTLIIAVRTYGRECP
jgi:hypothetical protein